MQIIFNLVALSIKMSDQGDNILIKCQRILSKNRQKKREKSTHAAQNNIRVSYGMFLSRGQMVRNQCTSETEKLIELEQNFFSSKK